MTCVICGKLITKGEMVWLNDAPAHYPICPKTSPAITVTSTPVTAAVSKYRNDGCEHCHAAYGHTLRCPLLNRRIAEAISAAKGNFSEIDKIVAHGLGVQL